MTGFGDETSGWWFYGRLRPTSETHFNVQEIVVRRDVRLEVFHDVIAAWSKPGPNALTGPAEVRELFGVMLGAYALITGVALDWTTEGWIEATTAQFAGAMIGTFADSRGPSPMLSPRAPRSVDMRRGCKLAVSVHDRPSYRLALRDVHATLLKAGDDAFVFIGPWRISPAHCPGVKEISGHQTGDLCMQSPRASRRPGSTSEAV